jgi:hypothetical protein
MDETLKKLAEAAVSLAEGRGVQLNLEDAQLIAQKGAEMIGALVSDFGWKKALAAGKAEGDKVQTFEDAIKWNKEH